jgi:hypothetical protein
MTFENGTMLNWLKIGLALIIRGFVVRTGALDHRPKQRD